MSKFVHQELNTSNPKAAKKFYSSLFGWKFKDMPMGGGNVYTIISTKAGEGFGGMQKSPMPNVPSHWLAYAEVESVDKAVKKVKKLGGKIVVPKVRAGDMGEFALFADPTGATFAVWHSLQPQPAAKPKKATKKRATKKTAKKATKKRATKKPAKKATTKKRTAKKRTAKKATKKATKKAAKKATKKAAKKTTKRPARKTAKKTTKRAAKKTTRKRR